MIFPNFLTFLISLSPFGVVQRKKGSLPKILHATLLMSYIVMATRTDRRLRRYKNIVYIIRYSPCYFSTLLPLLKEFFCSFASIAITAKKGQKSFLERGNVLWWKYRVYIYSCLWHLSILPNV